MTSSEDGTIRLWDTAEVTQKTVIKPMLRKTGRTNVSVCAYNNDGGSIAAGLADGSLHIWDAKGKTKLGMYCYNKDLSQPLVSVQTAYYGKDVCKNSLN